MANFRAELPDLVARLRVDADRAFGDADRLSNGLGKKIGLGIAAGVGVGLAGVGVLLKNALSEGLDQAAAYTEASSKATVLFGKAGAEGVKKWAEQANAIGLSDTAALQAIGTYGNLYRAMQFSKGESAKYSKQLTGLAADLASFNDATPEEAIQAIQSALIGESEPIRAYGVVLNEATIQAKALDAGLVKASVDMVKVRGARLKLAQAQQALNDLGKEDAATAQEREAASIRLAEAQQKQREVARDSRATDLDRRKAALAVKTAQEALTKVTKGGTVSTLEREAALQRVAEAEAGIEKALAGSKIELDDVQKAEAIRLLILEKTKAAQGDALRSLDGSYTRQRQNFQSMRDDLNRAFGNAAMPAGIEVLKTLNESVLPSLQKTIEENGPEIRRFFDNIGEGVEDAATGFADWLKNDAADDFDNMKESVRGFLDEVKPFAVGGLEAFNTAFTITKDLVVAAAPIAKDALDAFNGMPDWAKQAVGIAVAGGFTVGKINALRTALGGGPAGGAGGGLGGMNARGQTRTRPLFVDVVGGGLSGDGNGNGTSATSTATAAGAGAAAANATNGNNPADERARREQEERDRQERRDTRNRRIRQGTGLTALLSGIAYSMLPEEQRAAVQNKVGDLKDNVDQKAVNAALTSGITAALLKGAPLPLPVKIGTTIGVGWSRNMVDNLNGLTSSTFNADNALGKTSELADALDEALGDYVDEYSIDLDRLARSIQGEKNNDYFNEISEALTVNAEGWKGIAGGLGVAVPGWQSDAEKMTDALSEINGVLDAYRQIAQEERDKAKAELDRLRRRNNRAAARAGTALAEAGYTPSDLANAAISTFFGGGNTASPSVSDIFNGLTRPEPKGMGERRRDQRQEAGRTVVNNYNVNAELKGDLPQVMRDVRRLQNIGGAW